MAIRPTRRTTVLPSQSAVSTAPDTPPQSSATRRVKIRVTPTGRFRIFAPPIGVYFVPDTWVEIEPHPWVLRQIQLGSLMAEEVEDGS